MPYQLYLNQPVHCLFKSFFERKNYCFIFFVLLFNNWGSYISGSMDSQPVGKRGTCNAEIRFSVYERRYIQAAFQYLFGNFKFCTTVSGLIPKI
jgi:hypothetical protein